MIYIVIEEIEHSGRNMQSNIVLHKKLDEV